MTDRYQREFGSPNSILWRYFACLRRLAYEAAEAADRERQRETAALAVLMAISAIEAFLNIWFRTFSEEGPVVPHRAAIMKDLHERRGLAYKFKTWPKKYLGMGFDLAHPPAATFLALVEQRNALMHFTTNYDSVEVPGVTVRGLVDITAYEALRPADAMRALHISEEIVCEFFRLRKADPIEVLKQRHYWTGRVPTPHELADAEQGA